MEIGISIRQNVAEKYGEKEKQHFTVLGMYK
jgi:hypothetical protein